MNVSTFLTQRYREYHVLDGETQPQTDEVSSLFDLFNKIIDNWSHSLIFKQII